MNWLNEFTTEYLAAMAFPALFPDGKGDPTKFSTRRLISKTSLDVDENDLDDDYADLVNCVQRHTKCSTAYCLRKKSNGEQYCRFKFPFEDCNETYIEFEEINSKKNGKQFRPNIVLKRNDSRVNRHQCLQLQFGALIVIFNL